MRALKNIWTASSEAILKLLIIIAIILFFYIFIIGVVFFDIFLKIFKKEENITMKKMLLLNMLFIKFYPIKEILSIIKIFPIFYLKKLESKIDRDSIFVWKKDGKELSIDFNAESTMWYTIDDNKLSGNFYYGDLKKIYKSELEPILRNMYKADNRDYLLKKLL